MIKINLLATQKAKKAKKRIAVESQLVWLGLLSFILILGWFLGWRSLDRRVEGLRAQETRLTEELTSLKAQVKVVENFEKNKKMVEDKIAVIQDLRKKQSMPVSLLNEISQRLPDRVWLVSLSESRGNIELSGAATTNSEIVDFINNLKAAPDFKNIEILESRQRKEGGITVYSFRLKWTFLI